MPAHVPNFVKPNGRLNDFNGDKKRIQMNMLLQEKLVNEIFAVTKTIQKNFPERYNLLNETPLFLTYTGREISKVHFEDYLESLKMQLAAFEKAASYQKMCE